jgi:hypothetical protein
MIPDKRIRQTKTYGIKRPRCRDTDVSETDSSLILDGRMYAGIDDFKTCIMNLKFPTL